MDLKVVKINLQHSRCATDNLTVLLAEEDVDIALIQEPWVRSTEVKGSQDVTAVEVEATDGVGITLASIYMAHERPAPPEEARKLVQENPNKTLLLGCDANARSENILPSCIQHEAGDIPRVTEQELQAPCNKIKSKKAPGPDGIPNRALKLAICKRPDIFQAVFQTCLNEGTFPKRWKKQTLVLLPKGNKKPGEPESFRPVCLLDTMGKILERIICDRLSSFAEDKGLSSVNPAQQWMLSNAW
ncbi:uncharacterized protein LOC129250716 [Anastrepha obliqua]|uniref:uncharacterized protein LOC129250716 n=1 Tax=Anastrepha obliqua TaxID=95512 RepID=UPI0024098618|nr:uncharacterized protein LOC129250716 [Anastrepha obliqua]